MMMKFSAFMLLICTTALLCTKEGQGLPPTQRCTCIKTHSRPKIPTKKILALKVIPVGPNCNHEEIIATVAKGQMCLNHTEDWVISLKNKFSHTTPGATRSSHPSKSS